VGIPTGWPTEGVEAYLRRMKTFMHRFARSAARTLRPGTLGALLVLAVGCGGPENPGDAPEERVHPSSPEASLREAEVIAVAEAFLRAISDLDGEAMRALSLPGGSVHALDLADDGSLRGIRSRSLENDAETISDDPEPLLERMWDPIAMVHGPLAMVWTPYDFWVAGEWSHCGIDIFTLAETEDGWKVSSISYTTEVSGCPESPLPPPTAEELGVEG
jgi:hypothetical protein